jgi:hypothetical protein
VHKVSEKNDVLLQQLVNIFDVRMVRDIWSGGQDRKNQGK